MADRPIIFSAPMVRALLDGHKTQTRRLVKYTTGIATCDGSVVSGRYPYTPGDRLYVREAARGEELDDGLDGVRYRADETFIPIGNTINGAARWLALHTYRGHSGNCIGPWVPPIHMPRWASRLTLTVTEVRVQRLQEISAEDSVAEGVQCGTCEAMNQSACHGRGCFASIDAFRGLWNRLHGADAWDANPWVVALTFTVQRGNIDQIGGAA